MKLSSLALGWSLLLSPLTSADGPASSNTPSETLTDQSALMASALNGTNQFRFQHNATALTWNNSLADAASSWASNCLFEHSTSGENLAAGVRDMTSAIDAWGNERDLYNFGTPTGFSTATGHFTQLVWKDTASLGCAAVDCTAAGTSIAGFLVVCQYWPPGNMVGQNNAHFRANVQEEQVTDELGRVSAGGG